MHIIKKRQILNRLKAKLGSSENKIEPYDDFAHCYDDVMKRVNYQNWVNYLLDLRRYFNLSADNILEIACGTGNMLIILKNMGYNIIGIDLSESMLELTKKKCIAANIDAPLYNENMTDFRLLQGFDLIFSFNDSINYLHKYSDLQKCFMNVYDHLNSGGGFIFDVTSEYNLVSNFVSKKYVRSYPDFEFIWKNSYNQHSRIALAELYFIYKDGRLSHETHIQKVYTINEIYSALKESGFSAIKIFSAFSFKDPSNYSVGYHFVAIKD